MNMQFSRSEDQFNRAMRTSTMIFDPDPDFAWVAPLRILALSVVKYELDHLHL
jgi:hypothetical protein